MPDVAMPNGDIVNFPDDMPKEQIKGMIATKFPEVSKGKEPSKDMTSGQYWKETGQGLKEGIKTGATFGLSDEIQSAIAAATVGASNKLNGDSGLSMGQAYDTALNDFRKQQDEAKSMAPKAEILGEVAGSIPTGIKTGGAIGKFLPEAPIAGTVSNARAALDGALRGFGGGALSGGAYGFGTGEGGAGSRFGNAGITAAMGGALGGAVGPATGAISNSLAARAARLLEIKRAAQSGQVPPMTGLSVGPSGSQAAALQKILERLRKDYPDPAKFDEVIQKLKTGEVTLGELGGEATQDLATGAAQYPSGKGTFDKFFEGQADVGGPKTGGAIDAARDNVTSSIEKNISGNQDFYGTLDDIVQKGQARAKPLYEKANSQVVKSTVAQTPEVQSAIQQARSQFPSELDGYGDDSVKVLDYAKRVLDDQIDTARRSGSNNLARARGEIKSQLVSEIDSQVPDYAQARKVAGDYLSSKSAMEAGREFKGNSKQIARDFAKLGDTEKEAYKAGVVQKVREMADSVRDNGNAYTKVFGTPETRNKLKAILEPDAFKKLSDDLWASDRIYTFRNKTLSGSTTAYKQIAREALNDSPEFLQSVAKKGLLATGSDATIGFIKKSFDGLSDKTAGEVARILTAKDNQAKLKIIRQLSDAMDKKGAANQLTPSAAKNALQIYYALDDAIKPAIRGVTNSAGVAASQPLRIRVHVQQEDKK